MLLIGLWFLADLLGQVRSYVGTSQEKEELGGESRVAMDRGSAVRGSD